MAETKTSKAKSKMKMSNSLAGKLLIAMPSIGDPRFQKAVIFMCAHDDKGAMGFMVNHSMPEVTFEKIIDQTGIKSDIIVDVPPIEVLHGGPVEKTRGFLLHSTDFNMKDTVEIDQNYAITGTLNALEDIIGGRGPKDMLFVLGHAGWEAGQLDRELQQNAWIVAEASPDLVFQAALDDKWTLALRSLGIDPGMLSGTMGTA